jgi:pilus assembly protein FimV
MAAALGLGELTLKSYLNEPLSAEVQLLEIGELDPTQIRVRLASREDFTRAGVERAYFLTSLKFEVVGDGPGGARLVITSPDPVREPYLDFLVEARWPTGRLLREYTVLLDPPVFVGDDTGITARASASRESGEPQQPARQAPTYTEEVEPAPAQRAMPERTYGSDALDMPAAGEKYMVQRGDTLWEIATDANPEGSTVQQTMLDILRLNPEAFIENNINQLKAGYVLRLPTSSEITRTFEDAVAEVERQTRRWQSGESAMDTRLDASEGLDVSGVAGSDGGEGHLQIAGGDIGDEDVVGGDISARMEDLDRVQRENAELSTRLGSMEEQLEMQERLITLKDEQIAALQDALEQAGADAEAPLLEQEGTIEAVGDEPPLFGEEAEPEPFAPAELEVAEPAQPEPQPAPQPAPPPPPPPPEPGILDLVMANIMYIAGGLLALVLLVFFLLRRRSSRDDDDELPFAGGFGDEDDFADVSLSDDSLEVDEFDEGTQAAPATAGARSYTASDEDAYAAQFETGDALAEADIYIAYGRFPQAVDLLKAAIAVEPANTDYRIKLMEACVEMVERGEFQQQYADLQMIGDENVLQRARALLEAVEGGESWLEGLPAPSITAEDLEEARLAQGAAAFTADRGEPEMADLGMDEEEAFESADDLELDEAALGSLDDDGGALDFDLEEDESGVETELAGSDDYEDSLDFSLGLESEPEPEPEEDELSLEPEVEAEPEDIDLPDLELESLADDAETSASDEDLLADLKELDLGAEEGAGFEEGDSDELDLSLEEDSEDLLGDLADSLDEPEKAPAAPTEEPEPLELEPPADELVNGSELDGVELDLLGDDSDDDLASMELDMSGDSDDDEGLVFAADGDEIATKLDLARAYIDMGDQEGARSILEEVIEGGNDSQQKEAQQLLEGIG